MKPVQHLQPLLLVYVLREHFEDAVKVGILTQMLLEEVDGRIPVAEHHGRRVLRGKEEEEKGGERRKEEERRRTRRK